MSASELFTELKQMMGITPEDEVGLKELRPIFARHGAQITDDFYRILGEHPSTAPHIEGRVAMLKATHGVWMLELFDGEYGEAYLDRRMRIGEVHVRVGIPPWTVEATMSHLRAAAERVLNEELPDRAAASQAFGRVCRILDLDLALINYAYNQNRLDLVSKATGMRRALLENLVKQGLKKKSG